MDKVKYQEAEMAVILLQEKDIILVSQIKSDDPIELPFVPRK